MLQFAYDRTNSRAKRKIIKKLEEIKSADGILKF